MRSAVWLLGAMGTLVGGMAFAQSYVVTVKPAEPQRGFEKLSISKAAIGATPIMIWRNSAINPDCTEVPGVTLTVLREPEHGTATVSNDPIYPSFPAANPRSVCNARKVPGHTAIYQAAAAYRGRDRLVLQGSSPDGRVREITVQVDVR